MPRVGTSAGVWRFFEDAIIACLREMGPFDYLIFEGGQPDVGGYVQLIVEANGSVMAECAGPAESGGSARWRDHQKQLIRSLGWEEPDLRGGWSNYRLYWLPSEYQDPRPTRVVLDRSDLADIASVVAATVERVLNVSDPDKVVKTAGNSGEGEGFEQEARGGSVSHDWIAQARPGQTTWTTSERRLLLEALNASWADRRSHAWNTIGEDAGFWGKVQGFTELGDLLLRNSGHSELREALASSSELQLSPRDRGVLLEALDVFVAGGGSYSVATLAAVRAKLE